jgi:hypothetical protein
VCLVPRFYFHLRVNSQFDLPPLKEHHFDRTPGGMPASRPPPSRNQHDLHCDVPPETEIGKSYVRRAVGKTDQDVDLDSLAADVFAAALRKLTAGGYVYQSQGQENAWLKVTALGVVGKLRAKHSRRLKRIREADISALMVASPRTYATTREDRAKIGEDVEPESD